jgi:outer membrane protein TolC
MLSLSLIVRSRRRVVARLGTLVALLVVVPAPVTAQSSVADAVRDTLRLSVEDAVTIALRQSDEVGIAAALVDVADALYGAARANVLPQLRVGGSYLHVYESARGRAVGAVFNQPNTYTANLNLSQTLFQGGKLVAAARAANELREAARFDEREQRANITLQVQRSYLQALFADRMAALQQRNLALAAGRVTQLEQFERAGQAARYDVLRARVARANIEPLVIQAESDRELARLELKRVLNLAVERPLALVSRIDAAAAVALLASLDDTSAVPERAVVRSAELNLVARQLGVQVARADYFPTLTAFLQSGYQAFPPPGQGFPTSRGNLSEANCPVGASPTLRCQNGGFFSDRQMGFNVSFPLFDGFRVKSNVDLAKAQARLAELQLQQQREAVSLDVARARAELRRARALFGARQQNSAEADEAFRLATLRFARGLSTQLEVSDAQLALLTAESTEARATYDLFLASADLARALGRPIPLPSTASAPSNPH